MSSRGPVRLLRLARSRRGQIVIPAMLIFPTLFLFVYLIYETAKLSREKIKHQFAMDAAAFVEMTNYSDFLNRTAYVNGAFPMRIFEEGYYDFKAECEGKVANCMDMYYADILFNNGAFPHLNGTYPIGPHTPEGQSDFAGKAKWNIEYGGAGAYKQVDWPPPSDPSPPWELFTLNDADHYWHPIDLANEIYKLYVQIYSLLGSVESAQFSVLNRLTEGSTPHTFLQKSYWLNSNDPVSYAATFAQSFDNALGGSSAFKSAVKPYCLQKMNYWGNKHLSGGIQPYVPQKTVPDVDLTDPTKNPSQAGCSIADGGSGGLFQLEYVNPSIIKKFTAPDATSGYPGLGLSMNWQYPQANYWNVSFDNIYQGGPPQLHTTISLAGANDTSVAAPAVWPDPTPKFQVREFP